MLNKKSALVSDRKKLQFLLQKASYFVLKSKDVISFMFTYEHILHWKSSMLSMLYACINFYDLSALGGCWFDVYIRRFIYKFLYVCPFGYTAVAGSGKVGPVNQVNHTSWVAVVTPTDRPKSVRNRCLIELFCGVVCVVTLPFWHFRCCRGFCHRTESDLLLFVFHIV